MLSIHRTLNKVTIAKRLKRKRENKIGQESNMFIVCLCDLRSHYSLIRITITKHLCMNVRIMCMRIGLLKTTNYK